MPDTDTSSDWLQSLDDPETGRRVRYPGWDLTPLSVPLTVTGQARVIVGIAPDNAFDVVSTTLQSARRTISVEVYSLRHPDLLNLLVAKARAGVDVTVLLEGDPVGVGIDTPEWQTELYACQTIEQAGGACWFMVHETADRRFNRYEYIHAKMIVVDDAWVLIGSQNFTLDGLPGDDKANGTAGSRGTVIATDSPLIVERAALVFALDCDPTAHADLVRWGTLYPERYGPPAMDLVDLAPVDGISYTVAFPQPLAITGSLNLELFTAPEAALRRSDALLGLVSRAGEGNRVYVEQLYEYQAWGDDPVADPNLRLHAYVEAARRGAQVRILLNGQSFVENGPAVAEESMLTVQYVNDLARREHLDLWAAVGNPTGQGIHNKMVLIDLGNEGQTVHIGSINGSEASSKVNREVALQVTADAAYDYLSRLFQYDWWTSNPLYLPLISRAYAAPLPPVDYVVISEVAYTGIAATEWIELYNPMASAIDLGGYKLGDAETPASFEPMFAFPQDTTLDSQAVLVIAVNATQVPAADLEFYDSSAAVSDMVPYPAWGSLSYPLGLRNLGDQVLLLGPDDTVVDVVVWGDATFEDVVPHPGVLVAGASLERSPAYADTDDCAKDFRERYPPTPGELSP